MLRLTPCTTLRSTLPACLLAGGLLLPMVPPAAADPLPSPLASSLNLTASTTQVVYGVQLGLTGALTRADGSAIVDAPVTVWSRTLGQAGRVKVGEGRTNSYGRLQVKIIPRTNAEYQMKYGGDLLALPADSNLVASNVQPRVTGAFTPPSVPL